MTGTINIGVLLACCADAAKKACSVICEVNSAREAGQQLEVTYKDISDPKSALTVADKRAQHAILKCIKSKFPRVAIVAEEDEEEIETEERVEYSEIEGLDIPEHLREVPLDEICLFIDPVDGTKEFVDGRLSAVQTLIGIGCRGQAVAGAIGLPFHDSSPVICALVGRGVVNLPSDPKQVELERPPTQGSVLTGSKNPKHPVVKSIHEAIGLPNSVPLGGAGNKILTVATRKADIAILNLSTNLWDTAAPEAMLRALGGNVTDFTGDRIIYDKEARVENCYGVLATNAIFAQRDTQSRTHDSICQMLRLRGILMPLFQHVGLASIDGESSAIDIARDIEGDPLTAEWLSKILKTTVTSYAAPESSAVRYLMSNACRLVLKTSSAGPRSVFYKRVILQDLEHMQLKARTAPKKLARDIKSYQIETAFLASRACEDLCNAGIHVARAYHAQMRLAKEPIDSRFTLLVEDFSPEGGWKQFGILEKSYMNTALTTLAKMHAFFWCSDKYQGDLEGSVWDIGTYWSPGKQPDEQFDNIVPGWERHKESFEDELSKAGIRGCDVVTLDNLGDLLAKKARKIADDIHGTGESERPRHWTLLHGDAKAANWFFRTTDTNELETGLIDFQWCGWGAPALDVLYLIISSACMSAITQDGSGEKQLLEHYYASLVHHLVEYGKTKSEEEAREQFTFEDLLRSYRYAFLDMSRVVFAYHWERIEASPEVLKARSDMLPSNSYNKSVPHALWLIDRTAQVLNEVIDEEAQ